MQAYAYTHPRPNRSSPPPGQSRTGRLARILALPLATLLLASTHAPAAAVGDPAEQARVTPLDQHIHAVPGRTLVVPVSIRTDRVRAPENIPVRLGDGPSLDARLYRLLTHPSPETAQTSPHWLEDPGRLTAATPQDRAAEGVPVGWVLVLQADDGFAPPPDADAALVTDERRLWIDGEPTHLRWVDDPAQPVLGNPGRTEAWVGPHGDRRLAGSSLRELAAPEARDPRRRWRYRMLRNRLDDPAGDGTDRFDDPIVEALAHQTEALWRHALHRTWRHRADLSTRLKRRLLATADLGDRRIVPAWPAEQSDLDDLLRILLDPHLDGHSIERRVESWMGQAPRAVAWIIDDAGTRDANSGASLATLGVANLHAQSAVCTIRRDRWAGTPELQQLERWGSMRRTLDPGPTDGDAKRSCWISVEDWDTTLEILPATIDAAPPGLAVGPLREPWTMTRWLTGTPPRATAPIAGLLLRTPADNGRARNDDQHAAGAVVRRRTAKRDEHDGWTLYLEGRGNAGAGGTLRLWLGPYRSPAAVVELNLDNDRVPDGGRLRRTDDRWAAMLPIPPEAIEQDGTLRLGVTHQDPSGRRWAWPRSVLPWQEEPGRAAADTRAWDPHQHQHRRPE